MDPIVTIGAAATNAVVKRVIDMVWDATRERFGKTGTRVEATVAEARDMMIDLPLNVPLQPPPDRVLFPILAGAVNEDAGDLRTRYAAMLAHSILEPEEANPAFPRILSELSPLEVRVLDWMFEESPYRTDPPSGQFHTVTVERLRSHHALNSRQAVLVIANLSRQKLIVDVPGASDPGALEEHRYQHTSLTTFGIAFVRACRPPRENAQGEGTSLNPASDAAEHLAVRENLTLLPKNVADRQNESREWGKLLKRFEQLQGKIAEASRVGGRNARVSASRPDEDGGSWEFRSDDPESRKNARILCLRAGSLLPSTPLAPEDRWLNYLLTIGEGRPEDSRIAVTSTVNGLERQLLFDEIEDVVGASARGCLARQAQLEEITARSS